MGLFDKLFGKKKVQKPKNDTPKVNKSQPQNSIPKKKQNYFLTNSEDFGLGEIELGIAGKVRVDGLLAISAMQKIAKAKNEPFAFNVMHTSLLEEGALTVPVVCTIGKDKYSIYFIYKEEELLKYKDLVNHVSKTPYPKLIHFSAIPIYDGYTPTPIIEPFQLADLRVDNDGKVAGTFAMWWSAEKDKKFHLSKSCEYLTQLNNLINGYETYMTGYVLRQTRIVSEVQLQRMKLPQENAMYVIDAPEEKKVLLDISQEKGIRFLFPVGKVTKEYRERFLKGAMVDFVANIISLKQQNAPKDEKIEPNSFEWFSFMSKVVREKEDSGELSEHQIGTIELNSQMN